MFLLQIRCFVSVAHHGSFTAAAGKLNLSQPSLGVHVRQLEQRYGVLLFERHARGATLTAAGDALLRQAEALLREADRMDVALRLMQRSMPLSLTLGVTPTAEAILAPDLLQRCATGPHPVKLTLVQGLSAELRQKTGSGDLDVALCYGAADEGGAGIIPLFSEDLYLVGKAAALRSTRTIKFSDLSRFPLTLDRKRQTIRLLIEETATEHDVVLDVQQEVELVDVKRALIQRHGCFTIVPYGLFLDEIRQGRMAARRITHPSLSRTMYVERRSGFSEPLYNLLVGWLHDIVRSAITEGELPWQIPRDTRG